MWTNFDTNYVILCCRSITPNNLVWGLVLQLMHNNSGVKVILLQSIRHVTIMWKSISQRFCENLSIKSPHHRPCLTTFFLCFITKQHFWYRICLVHDVVTKPHLVPNHIKQHPVPNQTTLRKVHKGNCLL